MVLAVFPTVGPLWSKRFLFLSLQATAEQIRLAQMISHNSDADFEEKVKQVRLGHGLVSTI